MANKIQLRRGQKSKLPTLSAGEPSFTTDTREFYIGTGSGNVNMGGSQWYTGTDMAGTSTTTTYSYGSCPQVKVGDMYLNTSNGNTYQCTTAGSAGTAKWTYKGSIRGATGEAGQANDDLSKATLGIALGTLAILYYDVHESATYAATQSGSKAPTDGDLFYIKQADNTLKDSHGDDVVPTTRYNPDTIIDINKNSWLIYSDVDSNDVIKHGENVVLKFVINDSRHEAHIIYRG